MTINYNQLWEDYYPKVYGYFFRRIDNRTDIEDLVIITITAWFQALESGSINNQNAFLWKVAHNQLCTFVTKKTKNKVHLSYDDEEFQVDLTTENIESERLQIKLSNLSQCIDNHLTGNQKDIIQKSILEDKKSQEVATEMSISPDNVRQILSRSIRKLKAKCKSIF